MSRVLIIKALMDDKQVKAGLDTLKKKGIKAGPAIARGLAPVVGKLAAIAAGAALVVGAFKLATAAFKAFIGEEEAINEMNVALQATGQFSEANSIAMQEWASATQNMTTVGNELLLTATAQGQVIAQLSGEDMPKLGQAILQVSKMYKIDLAGAASLVGKTIGSSTNALSRYGVELDTSASKTEKLAELLDKTSAGMIVAHGETETLTGAQAQLSNAWGDFLEIITGATGVTMPALVEVMKGTTSIINIFGAAVATNTANASEDVNGMASAFAGAFSSIGKGVIVTTGVIGTATNGLKMAWNSLGIAFIEVAQLMLAGVDNLATGFTTAVNFIIDDWNQLARFMPGISPIARLAEGIPALRSAYQDLQRTQDGMLVSLSDNINDQETLLSTLASAWIDVEDSAARVAAANTGVGVTADDLAGSVGGLNSALADTAAKGGGAAGAVGDVADAAVRAKRNVMSLTEALQTYGKPSSAPAAIGARAQRAADRPALSGQSLGLSVRGAGINAGGFDPTFGEVSADCAGGS